MEHKAEIAEKLTALIGYVDELEECSNVTPDEYRRDSVRRRAVERLCQVVVECAVDVNAMLIEAAGGSPPRSARESFEEAHGLGAVQENVRRRFCQTYVGLRNRIVHDYDTLDDAIVLKTAHRLVEDARVFAVDVNERAEYAP